MKEFFITLLKDGFHALIKLILAFGVGTGAGALVCWYYKLPMVLSLGGGILVLGIGVALMTDTIFD